MKKNDTFYEGLILLNKTRMSQRASSGILLNGT